MNRRWFLKAICGLVAGIGLAPKKEPLVIPMDEFKEIKGLSIDHGLVAMGWKKTKDEVKRGYWGGVYYKGGWK